jgi:hypothetical protein
VGDAGRVRQQPAEIGVRDERQADRRQDPPHRPARRLEHERHGHDAEQDIRGLGDRRAAEDLVGAHRGVADGHEGQRGERPVQRGRVLVRVLAAARAGAEDREGERQHDGEERRAVRRRVERVERPVDGEERQPGAAGVHERTGGPVQFPAGALGLVLLEQPLVRRRLAGRRLLGRRGAVHRVSRLPP